ncbi:MAG: hypothetical protein ACP5PJ_03035 [Acidimicrobiales bacterium]
MIDASLVNGVGSSVAQSLTHLVLVLLEPTLSSVYRWVAKAVYELVATSTTFGVDTVAVSGGYDFMAHVAASLALPFLLIGIAVGAVRGGLGELVRLLVLRLPAVVVVMVIGPFVVSSLSHFVDQSSRAAFSNLINGSSGGVGLPSAHVSKSMPLGMTLLLLALGIGTSLLLWLEFALRSALLGLATAFLPLAAVGLLLPTGVGWLRRGAEVISGLLVAKLVMVTSLAMAYASLASATSTDTPGDWAGRFILGVALFLVTAFAPYLAVRLVPFAEAQVAATVEGVTAGVLRRGVQYGTNLASVSDLVAPADMMPEATYFLGGEAMDVPDFQGYRVSPEDASTWGHSSSAQQADRGVNEATGDSSVAPLADEEKDHE